MINQKKKILVILPNFMSGGAERIHINLANEWQKMNYDVSFAVLSNHGPLSKLLDPGINIIDLKSTRIKSSIKAQRNLISALKPDYIISAMWPLTISTTIAWMGSFFKGKLYLVEHCEFNSQHLSSLGVHSLFFSITVSIFYNLASRIIVVSDGVKHSLLDKSYLVSNKVNVIINGTPEINFSDILHSKKELFHTSDPVILGVGTLKPQKDFVTLIKAFHVVQKITPVKLAIIGDGETRASLEALVLKLQLSDKVIFTGLVDDTSAYFYHADVFVHSSFYDGMPLVLLEALAAGTQIVSTDTPFGPKEILQNGEFGDIVPIQGIAEMAQKILFRLKTKVPKTDLLARAKDFSIKKVAANYLDLFLID